MVQLSLPPALLLLPPLLFGAIIGYRRTWGREVITAIVLALVLLGFDGLHGLVWGCVRAFARVVTTLTKAAHMGAPQLERSLNRVSPGLVTLACIVLFVILAYWLGSLLGREGNGSRLRMFAGAAVGALNVLMLLALVAAQARDVLGPARLRKAALVPGSGRGVDVTLPPFPAPAVLIEWSVYALVLLFVVGFCWAVSRIPKLRS